MFVRWSSGQFGLPLPRHSVWGVALKLYWHKAYVLQCLWPHDFPGNIFSEKNMTHLKWMTIGGELTTQGGFFALFYYKIV